jgi:hypothetical protein
VQLFPGRRHSIDWITEVIVGEGAARLWRHPTPSAEGTLGLTAVKVRAPEQANRLARVVIAA